jgi:hypothetical protein
MMIYEGNLHHLAAVNGKLAANSEESANDEISVSVNGELPFASAHQGEEALPSISGPSDFDIMLTAKLPS